MSCVHNLLNYLLVSVAKCSFLQQPPTASRQIASPDGLLAMTLLPFSKHAKGLVVSVTTSEREAHGTNGKSGPGYSITFTKRFDEGLR